MTPSDRPIAAPSFEDVVVPHLVAARRLARWLTGNEQDADDVVQEASLRAFRYFRTFTGGNGRAWFLRIVRNICYGWRSRFEAAADSFDEERHWSDWAECTPEALVLHADTAAVIEQALGTLPDRARELLVRREFEGLSYRELSDELHMPIGTVMSGLSRARQALRVALHDEMRRRSKHAQRVSPEHEADAARLNRPHQPDAGLVKGSTLDSPAEPLTRRSVSWRASRAEPVMRLEQRIQDSRLSPHHGLEERTQVWR